VKPVVRVLGPLEVEQAGRLVRLGGHKRRGLVALLATRLGAPVSVDLICDAIWPDTSPSTARNSALTYLSQLRHSLPIVRSAAGYQLEATSADVDATLFESFVQQAKDRDGDERATLLRDALSLWRGPALVEFADAPWAAASAATLNEQRSAAEEEWFRCELDRGRHGDLVAKLELACADEPFRERRWELFIIALYRSGRAADALQAYERLRTTLRDELGVEPSRRLKDLELSILRQDDSLDLDRSILATVKDQRRASFAPAVPEAFIERSAFADLVGVWRSRSLDASRVVILQGEAGTGKTALAARLASDVQRAGGTVLWGTCTAEPLCAYQPAIEMLSTLSPSPNPPTNLSELVVQLSPLVDAAPDDRLSLFRAFTSVLEQCTGSSGLLVVVDDMQWADAASIALFSSVVRATPRGICLLLIARRDLHVSGDELSPVFAEMDRHVPIPRVSVGALDRSEMHELVMHVAGEPGTDDFVTWLTEQTAGNILLVRELVREVVSRGSGVSSRPLRGSVPNSVRDLVAARLQPLPSTVKELLSAAAVLGLRFRYSVLDRVLARDTSDDLEAAVRAGICVETSGAGDECAFAHALVRDSLLSEVTERRRMHLNAATARALLAEPPMELQPAAISHHFRQAGSEWAEEWASWAAHAGQEALQCFAFEDAIAQFESAQEALRVLRATDTADSARMLLALADARFALEDTQGAVQAGLEAARIAQAIGDHRTLAAAALRTSRNLHVSATSSAALAVLEEALHATENDISAARARLIAVGCCCGLCDASAMEDSIKMASAVGDTFDELFCRGIGVLMKWDQNPSQQLRECERILRVAVANGSVEGGALASSLLTATLAAVGDGDGFRHGVQRTRAMAERTGQPFYQALARQQAAMCAQIDGHFNEAERLAREALAMVPDSDISVSSFGAQTWVTFRDQGKHADLVPVLRHAAETAPHVPAWTAALADTLAYSGKREGARAELDDLMEGDRWLASPPFLLGPTIACIISAAAALAASDIVTEPLARIRPLTGCAVVIGQGTGMLESVDYLIGLGDRALGDLEGSVKSFETAIAFCDRLGAKGALSRAQAELAVTLHRLGRRGDRPHIAVLAEQAARCASSLGLAPVTRRLSELDSATRPPV
jgi:DNA-binding SARP family transcriptional activator/tetratricopeptide (TPR) repeat protein